MRETRGTATAGMGAKSNPPPQPPSAASVHEYSNIQQSGRSVKTMNAKNTRKNHRFMRMRTQTRT